MSDGSHAAQVNDRRHIPTQEWEPDYRSWFRANKSFPHLWCPGCGLGIVLGAAIRAFEQLGFNKDHLTLVSGIGCTGRIPVYVDCNTLHTTHGRALTFATGIKLANPKLNVVTFMGDGDALAIGGNHFIHSCRRNMNLTAIVVNNYIYGMTGGQVSPTTPQGKRSSTTPYGQFARPFDICELAIASGATFVARSTAAHSKHMQKMMRLGLEHKGFSVVEIFSNCHTAFGRLNDMKSQLDMIKDFRDHAVRHTPKLDVKEAMDKGKKYVIGVLRHDKETLEFVDQKESVMNPDHEICPEEK